MMNLIAMIALNVNEFILMIVRNKSRQRVQSTKVRFNNNEEYNIIIHSGDS